MLTPLIGGHTFSKYGLTFLFVWLMLCLSSSASAWGVFGNSRDSQRKKDLLQVTLNINDEAGQPVPYATIWSTVSPRKYSMALTAEDLWRITLRYQASFEFATHFHPITTDVHVAPMGNAQGRFQETFDYLEVEGHDNYRPDQMVLIYTIMKRGYLPAKIDMQVAREASVSGSVTLKRDPSHPIETQPYMQKFEALRYELSDTNRDERISVNTHLRNEELRSELEALAEQAIAAGDKSAAARIYMRMVFMPTIVFYDGKPAGWAHQDASSEQSKKYETKAYELDPDNPYIASMHILGLASVKGEFKYRPEKATIEEKQKFEDHLIQFEHLLNAHPNEIWPGHYRAYIARNKYSTNQERVNAIPGLYREFHQFEPKYPY